jgi:hypothetical protein
VPGCKWARKRGGCEKGQHGDAGAGEQHDAGGLADPAGSIGERGGGVRKVSAEEMRSRELDRKIEDQHEAHGEEQGFREGAVGVSDLAAGAERGFHAAEREQAEHDSAAEPAGLAMADGRRCGMAVEHRAEHEEQQKR